MELLNSSERLNFGLYFMGGGDWTGEEDRRAKALNDPMDESGSDEESSNESILFGFSSSGSCCAIADGIGWCAGWFRSRVSRRIIWKCSGIWSDSPRRRAIELRPTCRLMLLGSSIGYLRMDRKRKIKKAANNNVINLKGLQSNSSTKFTRRTARWVSYLAHIPFTDECNSLFLNEPA